MADYQQMTKLSYREDSDMHDEINKYFKTYLRNIGNFKTKLTLDEKKSTSDVLRIITFFGEVKDTAFIKVSGQIDTIKENSGVRFVLNYSTYPTFFFWIMFFIGLATFGLLSSIAVFTYYSNKPKTIKSMDGSIRYLETEFNMLNSQSSNISKKIEKKMDQQKNYKVLIFKKSEFVDKLEKISDVNLQTYFVNRYYENLKTDIQMYIEYLEELNDKSFAKTVLDRLNSIKYKTDSLITEYNNTLLSKIDSLREDLRVTEDKITNFGNAQTDTTKIKISWKIRPFRIIFSLFFGIESLIYIFQVILGIAKQHSIAQVSFMTLILLICIITLINEFNHIKNYNTYKIEQEKKIQEQQQNNLIVEQNHNQELENLKKHVQEHQAFVVLQEISMKYNDFNRLSDDFNQAIN